MSKFTVYVDMSGYCIYSVEAETEQEAWDIVTNGDGEYCKTEYNEIDSGMVYNHETDQETEM